MLAGALAGTLEGAGMAPRDLFAAAHHVRRWAEVVGYHVAWGEVHVPDADTPEEAARRLVVEWTLAGRPVFTAERAPYGTWEALRRWVDS